MTLYCDKSSLSIKDPVQLLCCKNWCCFLCANFCGGCPVCDCDIPKGFMGFSSGLIELFDASVSTLWLYSSNYNNTWWGYDRVTNKKIMAIHDDYIKRTTLDSDNSSGIEIKAGKCVVSAKKGGAAVGTADFINVVASSSNYVDFSSLGDDESVKPASQSDDLSYVLKIGQSEYMMDFDQMKQINTLDPWKRRSIKCITIPSSDNVLDKLNFLMNNHVVGIAGIKFR